MLSDDVSVWKCMRQPFVLPILKERNHVCRWEVFGSGLAGCVICGDIHRCCESGSACILMETEDSQVCTVTGVCVRPVVCEVAEYMDSVMPCQESKHMKTNDNSDHSAVLAASCKNVTNFLLTSKMAFFCFVHEQFSENHFFNDDMKFDSAVDTAAEIQKIVVSIKTKFHLPVRQKAVDDIVETVVYVLKSLFKHLGLTCKQNEISNNVMALLFLMRDGIYVGGICVLPQRPCLQYLLPRESNLFKFFGFKAKIITEIENKIKYSLRQLKKGDLSKINLNRL